MARLHLVQTSSDKKCIKCDCILLSEVSRSVLSEEAWLQDPNNCARVKPTEKLSQPIDYKEWK